MDEITEDNIRDILNQSEYLLFYFTATWCGPCQTLSPIMESLSGQINYEKIDVDNNQDLSIQYGVRNIPTLVLVENGEAVSRLTGVQSKNQILELYNR